MKEETKVVICTAKEVQKYLNVSTSTANRMIRYLRDVLDKPRPKIVLMSEFLEYFNLKD